jgi:hypothetical protein
MVAPTPTLAYKDPNDVLDYGVDWSQWLDGDTITASSWSAPIGITIDSESNSTTATTVWLSGGTPHVTYEVVNHITTAAGREADKTLRIKVMQR